MKGAFSGTRHSTSLPDPSQLDTMRLRPARKKKSINKYQKVNDVFSILLSTPFGLSVPLSHVGLLLVHQLSHSLIDIAISPT